MAAPMCARRPRLRRPHLSPTPSHGVGGGSGRFDVCPALAFVRSRRTVCRCKAARLVRLKNVTLVKMSLCM